MPIKWEPPPSTAGRTNWVVVLEVLKTRKGEWARVWEGASKHTAYNRASAIRKLGCEARVGPLPEARFGVWARVTTGPEAQP